MYSQDCFSPSFCMWWPHASLLLVPTSEEQAPLGPSKGLAGYVFPPWRGQSSGPWPVWATCLVRRQPRSCPQGVWKTLAGQLDCDLLLASSDPCSSPICPLQPPPAEKSASASRLPTLHGSDYLGHESGESLAGLQLACEQRPWS